jgi:hypothetical protein
MPRKSKVRRHKRKTRRTRRRSRKGGNGINGEQATCCMCETVVDKGKTYIPRKCLTKNMQKAHRICENCWWSTFAEENATHACPGCVKGLPLTEYKQPTFIDLVDD